jgi:hypothetical protein
MTVASLTHDRLLERLAYNPETGVFTWLWAKSQRAAWNSRHAGRQAGALGIRGYICISIDRRLYPAHRLAWLYVKGVWPAEQVDHINHDRTDNRMANLREVSKAENAKNKSPSTLNKSGLTGVSYNARDDLWVAMMFGHKNRLCLGNRKSLFEAACLRKSAEVRYGFHENHGLPATRIIAGESPQEISDMAA